MKLAFVAPFFGAHAAGGAEAECRATALHLAERGHEIDILTTCLLDLQHDWNVEAFAAGVSADGPLTVRRFRSDPVDTQRFARLNLAVQSGRATPEEARAFTADHINSRDLYRWLADHHVRYDRVVFIPYLFGTTLYGSRLCPEKTILIPCLHDEGYARLPAVRDLFHRAARIVFHVEAEARLAETLYGPLAGKSWIVGEGVDTVLQGDAARFRKTFAIGGPFLLCCGRKDASKNTPELLRYFAGSPAVRRHGLHLVLLGPGSVSLPPQAQGLIHDLGFVSHQDKFDAYAACSLFVQPSRNESFSLVLMEAWDFARPVLVHADCEVLRDHVLQAQGGLAYAHAAGFSATVDWLLSHPDAAVACGQSGQHYVRSRYAWPEVMHRWETEVLA